MVLIDGSDRWFLEQSMNDAEPSTDRGAAIQRPPVHRITLAQLGVLVLLCLPLAVFDVVSAYSVACGGLIAIAPQAWFAAQAFRHRGAGYARAIARRSFAGEIGKFLMSIAGFALVFALLRPINGLAVFTGFLLMWAIQVYGSWRLLRDTGR